MSRFDELTIRHNSGSMKWDAEGDGPDIIPLWVADMDFRTAPAVDSRTKCKIHAALP